MPDTDKNLKINIELDKTGTGGTEAKAEIKALADETERYNASLAVTAEKANVAADGTTALNRAAREYAEQVKSAQSEMEASGGAFIPENLAGKVATAATATEQLGNKAEISHLAFRHLARVLGEDIPGASAVMEAGFESAESGMMGSVFLLIAGVEMLRAAMEKINTEKEQSQKLSEALSDADAKQTTVLEKQREAAVAADVAQAEYLHNLTRNTQDAIERSAQLVDQLVKARIAAAEGEDNTRKRIATNEIDEMEKRGVVSHATALQMKEQLDIQYEQQKLARMKAQDAAEMAELQRQYANRQINVRNLTGEETGAEAKYKAAAIAKAGNDAKMDDAKGKIADAHDVISGLRDTGINPGTIQELQDLYAKITGDTSGTVSLSDMFQKIAEVNLAGGAGTAGYNLNPNVREAHDLVGRLGSRGDVNLGLYEGAQKDIALGKLDLSRARGAQTGLDIAEGNAKSDLDAMRGELQKNTTAMHDLADKITSTAGVNKIKEGAAQTDVASQIAKEALNVDEGTAAALRAGQRASPQAIQQMMADASTIAGHQVTLQQAITVMSTGAANINAFMVQLDRLTTAFSQLDLDDMGNLSRRIDVIESQVSSMRGSYLNG